MSIFSKLSGTMQRVFMLGRKGIKLKNHQNSLQVKSNDENTFVPVSGADPTSNENFVTLSYFNSHSNTGSTGILRGTNDPQQSLGIDGNIYFKVDASDALKLYIKDLGIWKPLITGGNPPTDSDYVSNVILQPSDFSPSGNAYVSTIPQSQHQRTGNLIVQLQGDAGDISLAQTQIDINNNITISLTSQPSSNITVLLIGDTTLTTTFSKKINKVDWSAVNLKFQITIPKSEHLQNGNLMFSVYENSVDSSTSTAPYVLVQTDTEVDVNGNITITSNSRFSGEVVISGR